MKNLFIDNKYTKWYFSIIENRKSKPLISGVYGEKHHIIPKSIGGSNESINLVKLLPREHFLAHWLLTKMCINKDHNIKMNHALRRLMDSSKSTEIREWSKWQYEIAKKKKSLAMKAQAIEGKSPNQGKKHSKEAKERMRLAKLGVKRDPEKCKYLKTRKHSEETKAKMSASSIGRIVSSDTRRKLSLKQKGRPAERVECPHCNEIGGKPIMKRYHFNNCKKIG